MEGSCVKGGSCAVVTHISKVMAMLCCCLLSRTEGKRTFSIITILYTVTKNDLPNGEENYNAIRKIGGSTGVFYPGNKTMEFSSEIFHKKEMTIQRLLY